MLRNNNPAAARDSSRSGGADSERDEQKEAAMQEYVYRLRVEEYRLRGIGIRESVRQREQDRSLSDGGRRCMGPLVETNAREA